MRVCSTAARAESPGARPLSSMASRWVSAELSFDASGKLSASRKSRTGSERASATPAWVSDGPSARTTTLNDSDPHDETADEHIVFGLDITAGAEVGDDGRRGRAEVVDFASPVPVPLSAPRTMAVYGPGSTFAIIAASTGSLRNMVDARISACCSAVITPPSWIVRQLSLVPITPVSVVQFEDRISQRAGDAELAERRSKREASLSSFTSR